MKNVWKGMSLGVFAGAAVGLVLDGVDRVGTGTRRAAERDREPRD